MEKMQAFSFHIVAHDCVGIMKYVCKSDEEPWRHAIYFDCGGLCLKRQSDAMYHQISG